MVGIFPYAIGASVFSMIALLVYSTDFDLRTFAGKYSEGFRKDIDRADMTVSAADYLLGALAAGAVLWLLVVFGLHQKLVIALLALPVCEAAAILIGLMYLRFRGGMRLKKFGDQLEMVLRTISGAVRVGVGLRQAFVIVIEELPNPARKEFRRVVGRTNIGISLVDALDETAKSIPGNEMKMFVKVVRVQQQTGGDLASVLETLAATIRDRRRVMRKMSSLTAQGRFGAFIIGALPVGIGLFVIGTQPDMAAALLHTMPGYGILGLAGGLEIMAIISLAKILQLDV
ncbi:MAG: type II secretion system F family protein [Candidatus Eremiobacteraeota bacterium]|nr:type II secretion system F family protein [Candidatus Eremiobacteraeota bacterium]